MINEMGNIRIVNVESVHTSEAAITHLKQNVVDFGNLIEDCFGRHPPFPEDEVMCVRKVYLRNGILEDLVNDVNEYDGGEVNELVQQFIIWVYRAPLFWQIPKQVNFVIKLNNLLEVLHAEFLQNHFLKDLATWESYLHTYQRIDKCVNKKKMAHFVLGHPFALVKGARNYLWHSNDHLIPMAHPNPTMSHVPNSRIYNPDYLTQIESFLEFIELYPTMVFIAYRDLVRFFCGYKQELVLGSARLRGASLFKLLELDKPLAH